MNERRKRRLDHVPQYLEGSAAQQSVDAAASSSSPPSPYSRRHTSECELPSIPPVRRRLILSPEHMSPTGSTADARNKRRAAVASAREGFSSNKATIYIIVQLTCLSSHYVEFKYLVIEVVLQFISWCILGFTLHIHFFPLHICLIGLHNLATYIHHKVYICIPTFIMWFICSAILSICRQ